MPQLLNTVRPPTCPLQAAPAAAHDDLLQEALRINSEIEAKLEAVEEQAAKYKRCVPVAWARVGSMLSIALSGGAAFAHSRAAGHCRHVFTQGTSP